MGYLAKRRVRDTISTVNHVDAETVADPAHQVLLAYCLRSVFRSTLIAADSGFDNWRKNGPINVQNDYSLLENHYAWNTVADYVWIDQPV